MPKNNVVSFVSCLALLTGCGGGIGTAAHLPYDPNQTSIIGGNYDNADGLAVMNVETPDANGCIDLEGVCVQPQAQCGDNGRADVLIADGQVADVICYPTDGVAIESFDGPVQDVGNNVVLVLDNVDDGADVVGDVTIDGNNVTLYGHGPDTSVIDGNLAVEKNNSLVRGVRIEGDVTIDKNNASLVDCVITGDLTITGNDTSIALCEVWGKLNIEGNNTVLVSDRFQHSPEIRGENTRCSDDVLFADDNGDQSISDNELGEPVTCTDAAHGHSRP